MHASNASLNRGSTCPGSLVASCDLPPAPNRPEIAGESTGPGTTDRSAGFGGRVAVIGPVHGPTPDTRDGNGLSGAVSVYAGTPN